MNKTTRPPAVPQEVSAQFPVVTVVNNHVATTSLEVARVFEKSHRNVVRDIEALELPEDFRQLNFEQTSIDFQMPNGGVRKDKAYTITRDGFTILAMSYTGAKAMKFKLAYIEAFNKMEAERFKRAKPAPRKKRLLLPSAAAPAFDEKAMEIRIVREVFNALWEFMKQVPPPIQPPKPSFEEMWAKAFEMVKAATMCSTPKH